MAEVAVIVGVIAVACTAALLYLSGAFNRLVDSSTDPREPGAGSIFQPPVTRGSPGSGADCSGNSWRRYSPPFSSREECEAFYD